MFIDTHDKTNCPVCGYQTSDKICPYSIKGENNGKGRREHQTYNNIYSSFETNPYWDTIQGKEGFRLGWTGDELRSIYDNASKLVNIKQELVSSYVKPHDSMNKVFLTPSHLYGLTRDEVFALCLIRLYDAVEFPKHQKHIEQAEPFFATYNIPVKTRPRVFSTLGMLRNMYTISVTGAGDPRYKPYRVGLTRMLLRWSIPDFYIEFKNQAPAMFKALSIEPRIKKHNAISGFPNLANLKDRERYKVYSDNRSAVGYDAVFSQIYYHEIPRATGLFKQRLWHDLIWLMSSSDQPDYFGFPGFIFKPEDRLDRLLFLLGIASLRASVDTESAFNFVKDKYRLASVSVPYITVTDDVWNATDLWARKYILDNVTIHKGYVSAVARLGKFWNMESGILNEIFRRVCGYTGPPEFRSNIDNEVLTKKSIAHLQSGYDKRGNTAEMLNFKKALSLLAQFINDPSPMPYRVKPRYGLGRCKDCDDLLYFNEEGNFEFLGGCFEKIGPDNGMPVGNGFYNIILKYKCKKCSSKQGCREITVALNDTCPRCDNKTTITQYSFNELSIRYHIHCPICNHDYGNDEFYDNESLLFRFNSKNGKIASMNRKGDNGDDLFLITSPDDSTIVKIIEHPVNIKHELDAEPGDKVRCPYEIEESGIMDKYKDPCLQNMPQEWKVNYGKPDQSEIERKTAGKHRTVLVDTLSKEDGILVKRYICEDHRQQILDIANNLGDDPAKNPDKAVRGKASISSIYLRNKWHSINKKNAKLDPNRVNATLEIAKKPLSISTHPAIADNSDELRESCKYMRTEQDPDIPVSEEPTPPADMAHITFQPYNRLGIDTRQFFTFDEKEEGQDFEEKGCEQTCRDWERLELLRATLPFERQAKKYKITRSKKVVRSWEISHSPHKLIPSMSMPFIPTITPRERVTRGYGLTKTKKESSLVAVHIDVSGSMDSQEWTADCPYIQTYEECGKCGSGYVWDSKRNVCTKPMNRVEGAKRLMIGSIMNAQEKDANVLLYGFGSRYHLLNPSEFIVERHGMKYEIPCNQYDLMIDTVLGHPEIGATDGSTRPADSLMKMLDDLKETDIDKAVTIILTDGGIVTGDALYKAWYEILKDYGPIYLFQVGNINMQPYYDNIEDAITSLGWKKGEHYDFYFVNVSLTDGGLEINQLAGSAIDESLAE